MADSVRTWLRDSWRGSSGGWRIGLLVAIVAGGQMTRVATADEVIDRVLAVAAGELITQNDVAAARDLGLLPGEGLQPRDVVSRLIDRALMLAEVDRYAPPEPRAEAVDREVAVVRARFPSEDAFEAALARVGFDERYLRGYLRQDLRIRAYVDERFSVPDDQRRTLVDEWVAGLRRRATISQLDPTDR